MCHVTLWVRSPHRKSCECGDCGNNVFYLSRDHNIEVSRDCGWVLLILSHYPATFRVLRPYETGNSGVCNITLNSNSNSNSNSSAEVQCRGLQMVICFALKNLSLVSFRELQLTQI